MSNLQNAPDIEHSVSLLNMIDPGYLEEIREEYKKDNNAKEFLKYLELGVIGGKSVADLHELNFKSGIVERTLNRVIKSVYNYYIPLIQKKNQRMRSIELWSQIIIIISSSSLIGLIANEKMGENGIDWAGYIAAILSFLSALLTIILKQSLGEWSFNNRNTVNDLDSLIEYSIEGETLVRDLKAIKKNEELEDEGIAKYSALISKGDELHKKIKMIIEKYPKQAK